MGKVTSIQKRRRLEALFERGVEVRFNSDGVNEGDPRDDDVVIYVSAPSPYQREMAVREAHAARSRVVLKARKELESAEHDNVRAYLSNLDMDQLINWVVMSGDDERVGQARTEILLGEEWKEFNALRDAMRQWEEAGFPDTEEWAELKAKDLAFGEQVEARANQLRDTDREAFKLQPRAELEERAVTKQIENVGSAEFLKVYEEWMLYFACRDDQDHSVLFFESVKDLKSQNEVVQTALTAASAKLITEGAEAKNSPRVASGSTPSVPPVEPETTAASSPEESTA